MNIKIIIITFFMFNLFVLGITQNCISVANSNNIQTGLCPDISQNSLLTFFISEDSLQDLGGVSSVGIGNNVSGIANDITLPASGTGESNGFSYLDGLKMILGALASTLLFNFLLISYINALGLPTIWAVASIGSITIMFTWGLIEFIRGSKL